MNSYAAGPARQVYHIVLDYSTYTLCGLKVTSLRSTLPAKGSGPLYLLSEKPKDRTLCKHCERLQERSNYG